ncbi:MAG: hypothetical protein A3F70_03925 [Acidobacteria bacterium RIFCSPLOWO2_12_FULL_67_14]|nr:MAG: hypothetical protein A3H29_14525 [Acidobacteria bacterium RIFCSPLOWO2_02_FULL_67_21]OFW35369.1 MAG: hypothetical protein A3F70_03925 [Acidobacteria bacterium RIFCSPLOWO2_12_FULL_67_14]
MAETDDRMGRFEHRLDAMDGHLRVLTNDVGVLTDDVHVLKLDVQRLHVLYEHHDTQIRRITEVQAHHGRQLEEHGKLLREIKEELAPLADLRDFVRRVVENHENRIVVLEQHTGLQ